MNLLGAGAHGGPYRSRTTWASDRARLSTARLVPQARSPRARWTADAIRRSTKGLIPESASGPSAAGTCTTV